MAAMLVTLNHPSNKITGIKALRALTGLGLKDAKDLYEANLKPSGRFEAVIDTPFLPIQRTILEEGARAMNYQVTLQDVPTSIGSTGYYKVIWKKAEEREPWFIEVFNVEGRLFYRESGHHHLHNVEDLNNDYEEGSIYGLAGFAPSTAEEFRNS